MRRLLLSSIAFGVCAIASAQDAALQGFTGGSQFSSFDSTHMTVGWGFTLANDVFVTHLGYWDATTTDNLAHSHQIGIWDAGGTLVANETVAVDDPIIGPNPATGGFRYRALASPVFLAAGTYNVGAEIMLDGVIDNYLSSATTVTMLSGVTFLGARRNVTTGGFSNPTEAPSSANGRFGPNFIVTPVPEPATMAVLGLGALALMRRRFKK